MISPLVMKYIVPEQRNEAEKLVLNGEKVIVKPGECINCPRQYYVLEKFEIVKVSCPHCGIELKIRCYKNGNIKIERVFSK